MGGTAPEKRITQTRRPVRIGRRLCAHIHQMSQARRARFVHVDDSHENHLFFLHFCSIISAQADLVEIVN